MNKLLLSVAIFAAASSAQAAPFYMDAGTDFGGAAGDKECSSCTSMKDEFTLTYDSRTTITDLGGDGISAGDTVLTSGGLEVGGFDIPGLTTNHVTGFLPEETFGTESNNEYGADKEWIISFSIKDLAGVVTKVDAGTPFFAYGPGTLEMFVAFASEVGSVVPGEPVFHNFMDIAVTGGGTTGVGTLLLGTVDFSDVDAGYNDLFHSGTNSCLGDDSFYAIWSNCGPGAGDTMEIDFTGHFDTGVHVTSFTQVGNEFTLESNHEGSATFDVPEPASLALFGLGLLGLGFTGRKKSA